MVAGSSEAATARASPWVMCTFLTLRRLNGESIRHGGEAATAAARAMDIHRRCCRRTPALRGDGPARYGHSATYVPAINSIVVVGARRMHCACSSETIAPRSRARRACRRRRGWPHRGDGGRAQPRDTDVALSARTSWCVDLQFSVHMMHIILNRHRAGPVPRCRHTAELMEFEGQSFLAVSAWPPVQFARAALRAGPRCSAARRSGRATRRQAGAARRQVRGPRPDACRL
jgi:hypothetical protein